MYLWARKVQKLFWSMSCWSQLGEKVLESAEIILIHYVTNWDSEVQREAKHFAMHHLNPLSLLHALNSFFLVLRTGFPAFCACPHVWSPVILLLCMTRGLSLRILLGDRIPHFTMPGKWNSTSTLFFFHRIPVKFQCLHDHEMTISYLPCEEKVGME